MGMVASEKDGAPWKTTQRAASPEGAIREEPTQRGRREFMRREQGHSLPEPPPDVQNGMQNG